MKLSPQAMMMAIFEQARKTGFSGVMKYYGRKATSKFDSLLSKPKFDGNIAIFSDGTRYVMRSDGWRRIGKKAKTGGQE